MIEKLGPLIVRIFFQEIVVEGRENLPSQGVAIFTPNHPNALLDPLLVQSFVRTGRIRFVAKAPLFKIPVFGWILRRMGAIPVVRRFEAGGNVDYTEFFQSCVAALESGDSIVIFPEGRSLPQPHLAPLKTGPARLFFMARERGIAARVVPVGLNYERGMSFRSSVQISIAPSIETQSFETIHSSKPKDAVNELTDSVAETLAEHIFQAESYRDRELMLLLERLRAEEGDADGWPDRLARLKVFESALATLRQSYPDEIDRVRRLLARYQRLLADYGMDPVEPQRKTRRSSATFLLSAAGMTLAALGVVLNFVPYRLVDLLVRITRKDESETATFKVTFSLFLFPVSYVAEGFLIAHLFGWPWSVLFGLLIVPLSWFTLRFFEWREETSGGNKPRSQWFSWNASRRIAETLERLRQRILTEVDNLAGRL